MIPVDRDYDRRVIPIAAGNNHIVPKNTNFSDGGDADFLVRAPTGESIEWNLVGTLHRETIDSFMMFAAFTKRDRIVERWSAASYDQSLVANSLGASRQQTSLARRAGRGH